MFCYHCTVGYAVSYNSWVSLLAKIPPLKSYVALFSYLQIRRKIWYYSAPNVSTCYNFNCSIFRDSFIYICNIMFFSILDTPGVIITVLKSNPGIWYSNTEGAIPIKVLTLKAHTDSILVVYWLIQLKGSISYDLNVSTFFNPKFSYIYIVHYTSYRMFTYQVTTYPYNPYTLYS